MKKLLLCAFIAGLLPLPFTAVDFVKAADTPAKSDAAPGTRRRTVLPVPGDADKAMADGGSFVQTAAPAADDGLSAQAIVDMVMMSRALGKDDKDGVTFPGELNRGGKSVPFKVQVLPTLIRFYFENPKQNISLDTNEKGFRLREVTAGSNKEVPASMYSSGVRGTDLTYDDISMRYLYWPSKQKIGEETIKTRKCYVVDLKNPQKLGEYYLVRIFVDKKSGGLMRMMAYGWDGKLIKSCTVTAGMKVNGTTVMQTMEVIRYVPGTMKVAGETTFELKKPK